jgi:threonine/homoserine/homoserine lactone efflux protein
VPSRRQRFLLGLLTNVTNPKGIVFSVAVLPQFINPYGVWRCNRWSTGDSAGGHLRRY